MPILCVSMTNFHAGGVFFVCFFSKEDAVLVFLPFDLSICFWASSQSVQSFIQRQKKTLIMQRFKTITRKSYIHLLECNWEELSHD